jgi:type I restriction enzyme S subunit
MSLAKYPDITDSGVNWLGKVPLHWTVSRVSYLFRAGKGRHGQQLTQEFLADNAGDYPVYSGQTQDDGQMGTWNEFEFDFPGDGVLFSTTVGAKAMHLKHLSGKFSLSQNCLILWPNDTRCNVRFYYYHLQPLFAYERGKIPEYMQASFRIEDLYSYPICLPPLDEQRAIVSFLDVETSKIDGLVSEQRRLIELLKEKRQAVISHAVTKGLNPNAPMKNSGIQWLGDVPEDWNVGSVRRVINAIEQGWSPQCDSRPAEANEWGILKTGCVNRGVFSEIENKALPHDLEPIAEYEVKSGDVLMSRASGSPDLVGATAFVFEVRPKLMLSDKTFRIHLAESMEPMFFVSVFNSQLMRAQIEQSISGAEGLANNLPQAKLKCFSIALPPRNEQVEIVKELALRCKHFDTLQAESERAIELLKERRTALISAAVTGKIDVREFTPVSGKALAAGSSTVVPKVSGKALAAGSSERLTSKVLKS